MDDETEIGAGLQAIARALRWLGNADASTPMGGLEAHGKATEDGANRIADALSEVASAIRDLSEAVTGLQP